jgi:hypothetical protein
MNDEFAIGSSGDRENNRNRRKLEARLKPAGGHVCVRDHLLKEVPNNVWNAAKAA